jgi:hypothetical protein
VTGNYEYRVGARDAGGTTEYDHGVYATLAYAEAWAEDIRTVAEPPYDEVWIERRPSGPWERITPDERREQSHD